MKLLALLILTACSTTTQQIEVHPDDLGKHFRCTSTTDGMTFRFNTSDIHNIKVHTPGTITFEVGAPMAVTSGSELRCEQVFIMQDVPL